MSMVSVLAWQPKMAARYWRAAEEKEEKYYPLNWPLTDVAFFPIFLYPLCLIRPLLLYNGD
jgi:hypothetical protein